MISVSATLFCWLSYKAGATVPAGAIWFVGVLADVFLTSLWIIKG